MKKILLGFFCLLVACCAYATEVIKEEVYAYRDTLRIYGKMFRPECPGKLPAVVCSHSSSLTHEAMKGYAEKLAEAGYAAYCFDFCGGSEDSQSSGSTDSMTVFTEVEDLRAVVAMVKQIDYVDSARVVLLGSSQGGLVSAILAEQLQDAVASMVLFYPAFNIPELVSMFSGMGNGSWGNGSWGDGSWGNGSWGGGSMGSMMSMSDKFIDTIKDYDVWSNIGTYSRPVCIVHGTSDFIVPISNSEKAVQLYPHAELHPIEGANHGFNEANLGGMGSIMGGQTDYDGEVMPIVINFLKDNVTLDIRQLSDDMKSRSSSIYNLRGQVISAPRHGEIYIYEGKKMIGKR